MLVRTVRTIAVLAILFVFAAGCGVAPEPAQPAIVVGDRLLSQSPILAASPGSSTDTGRPPALPADDAPHANLTEWWYYTGHLEGDGGQRYGFEFVIFQSTLGGLNVGYASHFAVTDLTRGEFRYAERIDGVPASELPATLDLRVGDWTLQGGDGFDRFSASMPDYELRLETRPLKPPVLHDGDGIISFGPAGDSYYYSRTRLAVSGQMLDRGTPVAVSGEAWMDHQWGDYLVVGGGGWDWFSAQLADNTELTVSVVRDVSGADVLRYGTYVRADGSYEDLQAEAVRIEPLDTWTSPQTGIVWPSGWRITIARLDAELEFRPQVFDQELDTRKSTGVIYWEGAVAIGGRVGGQAIDGRGYVELTGYSAESPN